MKFHRMRSQIIYSVETLRDINNFISNILKVKPRKINKFFFSLKHQGKIVGEHLLERGYYTLGNFKVKVIHVLHRIELCSSVFN